MIEPTKADVGRRVIYTPFPGGDVEFGTVASVPAGGGPNVFVRFDGDNLAKATPKDALIWEPELELVPPSAPETIPAEEVLPPETVADGELEPDRTWEDGWETCAADAMQVLDQMREEAAVAVELVRDAERSHQAGLRDGLERAIEALGRMTPHPEPEETPDPRELLEGERQARLEGAPGLGKLLASRPAFRERLERAADLSKSERDELKLLAEALEAANWKRWAALVRRVIPLLPKGGGNG